MTRLANPVPLFLNASGALLDNGYVYVGVADTDPEDNPVDLFLDKDLTIPVTQPLRTIGGAIVVAGNRVLIYFAEEDVSITVRTANRTLVDYQPSAVDALVGVYQPADADLTAIANLDTHGWGRNLLTLTGGASLRSYAGIPDALPKAGGEMTGDISRNGAGDYLYWGTAAMTSGRVFVTVSTDPDPTSATGDIWITYDP